MLPLFGVLPKPGYPGLSCTVVCQAAFAHPRDVGWVPGPRQNWIKVDLTNQTLTAYRGATPLRIMLISSGVAPRWRTPTGLFWIYQKRLDDRMRGEDPKTGERWDVPHVPYAQYFEGGIAIHGAWWNHAFGTPNSHGCIQLSTRMQNSDPDAPEDAGWLYQFTRVGTPVKIVGTTPDPRARQPVAYPEEQFLLPSGARSATSSSQ
jgi:hypothetical protein